MSESEGPRPVRRRDREVTDRAWMRAMLEAAPVGVLSMVEGGRPAAAVNLFALDPERDVLYLHTARAGHTRDVVSAEPAVCFTVARSGRLLPAAEALEFSVEYASVVVGGRASVVEDAEEARAALQAILDRYAPHLRPGEDYRPIAPEELRRTTVYRVDIDSWHGKEKRVEGHVEGAYPLEPEGWFGV